MHRPVPDRCISGPRVDAAVLAARRFYAVPVDAVALAVSGEVLADDDGLVAAHLGRAAGGLATIDRTLSGFYVLEQRGTVTYLADLRDGGQVYRQDDPSRELVLAFDRVDDFRRFRIARDGPLDFDAREEEQIARRFRPRPLASRGSRCVSTSALYTRFEWLARFFGPAPAEGGIETSSMFDVARALGDAFPSRDAEDRAFAAERVYLADDPHLGLYWLLHSRVLAAEDRVVAIRAAFAASEEPLVHAFLAVFGGLAPDGDVAGAPAFRSRRSELPFFLAQRRAPRDLEAHQVALLVDPVRSGFHKASILFALAESLDAVPALVEFSREHRGPQLGLQSLAALLDRYEGASRSAAADAALRAILSDDDPGHLAACLERLHDLADDRDQVHTLVDRVLARDPCDFETLTIGREASLRDGDSLRAARFARRLAEIDETRHVWSPLRSWDPEEQQRGVVAYRDLSPSQRRFLALWLIDTPHACRPGLGLAVATILESGEAAASERLLAAALAQDATYAAILADLRPDGLASPADPILPFVQALLLVPEHEPRDSLFFWKRSLTATLVPIAHDPAVFDWLIAALSRENLPRLRSSVLGEISNYRDGVPGRLTAEQLGRLVRSLAELPASADRDSDLAMAWMFFNHPGAGPVLRELLDRPGSVRVQEWIYDAVGNLPRADVVRLFGERLAVETRVARHLAWHIANLADDANHSEFMAVLRAGRSLLAAGTYAAVYLEFPRITRSPPHAYVEAIASEVLEWPEPDDPRDRGRRKYVLLAATRVAIESGHHDLARRAHRGAAAIVEPAFLDANNDGSDDPFADDPALAGWLAAILAGELPRASAVARRRRPISDDTFARLAGVPIARRLLTTRTGEVWCLDRVGRVLVFAGDTVLEAPFRWVSVIRGAGEFLAGVKRCHGRATHWNATGTAFMDIACYDDRLLIHEGTSGDEPDARGLIGASHADAEALFTAFADNPPEGWSSSEPWYVAGRGAIVRTCRLGGEVERHEVLDLADTAAARADAEARILGVLRHHNANVVRVECSPRHRRATDCEFLEHFAARARDDARDAVWHLEAFAGFAAALRKYGWDERVPGLSITRGEPVEGPALARFRATLGTAMPGPLLAAWRDHGPLAWRLGDRGATFLSPDEALARRPVLAALVEAEATEQLPHVAEALRREFTGAVILVEDRSRRAVLFLPHARREDGQFVVCDLDRPLARYVEGAPFAAVLAKRLVVPFVEALGDACPELRGAPFGATPDIPVIRRSWRRADEICEVVLDPNNSCVLIRRGIVGAEGSHILRRFAAADLARAYARARGRRLRRDGFVASTATSPPRA